MEEEEETRKEEAAFEGGIYFKARFAALQKEERRGIRVRDRETVRSVSEIGEIRKGTLHRSTAPLGNGDSVPSELGHRIKTRTRRKRLFVPLC